MVVNQKSLQPIDFDGLRIFDYTAQFDCSSSVALIEVPSGVAHPEAWSKRSDKYYLVTEGSVAFMLENGPVELSAGDFCIVRRGQHFSYRNERADPATMVLVHTPPFRLEDEVFPGSA